MLLSERENRILGFLVRDYIKTAEPVSSSRIREGLKLGESPATIRNIVADLDDSGFLEQPHTSAGRVPTDTAYRYFVDHLMSEIEPEKSLILEVRRQLARQEEETSRFLAEALNLLSFSSFNGSRFKGYGLSYLLEEPEFSKNDNVRDAGYLVDHINDIAELYTHRARESQEIFIGRENPLKCAHEFGVFYLASDRQRPRTIILVGPKRMNYERVSGYINYILEEI